MYYIGVDLGTSAVKLLLMEGSGKICNIVSKEYPLFFPHPGWSEQNPEDWFAQSMEGIKELTEGIDRKEVAGIGFGGQMHGLVTLDKDHASEGLSCLSLKRILLHRCIRCFRYASSGCEEPLLVKGNA